jgi:prolyl-tRNA synthetase
MGSYGLGISRLLGAIVEVLSDENGLVWPENIAPAKVYLIGIGADAGGAYEELAKNGIEVIWDDRENVRPGEKFADAELMGIPYRVVVSAKLGSGSVEVKARQSNKAEIITLENLIKKLS